MLKITNKKVAQREYPGGYMDHNEPPVEYGDPNRNIKIPINEEGLSYIAHVETTINQSNGSLENAQLLDIELNAFDPDPYDWITKHWKKIQEWLRYGD